MKRINHQFHAQVDELLTVLWQFDTTFNIHIKNNSSNIFSIDHFKYYLNILQLQVFETCSFMLLLLDFFKLYRWIFGVTAGGPGH